MSRPHAIFILYFLAGMFLAFLVCRRRLKQVSETMRMDLHRLLDRQTAAARGPCEKLLNGLEASKAIADDALRAPARTQELQRALSDISSLLAKTLLL